MLCWNQCPAYVTATSFVRGSIYNQLNMVFLGRRNQHEVKRQSSVSYKQRKAQHKAQNPLLTTQAPVVAVSPIVAGAAIKGPTAAIMESMGHDVSALGVARLYADLIDVFMLDAQDGALAAAIKQETGVVCVTAQTIMRGPEDKRALAEATLTAAQAVVSATA